MARKASSGLSKFEPVNNAMDPSDVAGRTRNRGFDRAACRAPEARSDVAVRPKQIGGSRLRIVARPQGVDRIGNAADPHHADALGPIDRRAVWKFEDHE